MTDDHGHPYLRALHVIEALLRLSQELHAQNVALRVSVESRLVRIESRLTPVPQSVAPIGALTGTRHNRAAQMLRALEQGPLRGIDLARICGVPQSQTHAVLTRLRDARQIAQTADKRWALLERPEESSMPARLLSIMSIVLLCLASIAGAQPVLNPARVVFEPSADHDVIEIVTGRPLVEKYVLGIIADGANAPMTSVDLGKPSPSGGEISAAVDVLLGLPVGQKFTAIVSAVGPSGSSASEVSDPFGRALPPSAPPRPRVTR